MVTGRESAIVDHARSHCRHIAPRNAKLVVPGADLTSARVVDRVDPKLARVTALGVLSPVEEAHHQ